jgi:isopenicillin N synthase-like dioxygenase
VATSKEGVQERQFEYLPRARYFKFVGSIYHRAELSVRYFTPLVGTENLKEGFEIGPSDEDFAQAIRQNFNLSEAHVPPRSLPDFSRQVSELYKELQPLSRTLSILASTFGQIGDHFDHFTQNSLSTLRFLHYHRSSSQQRELCCTPHTNSGILTLLYQDSTGSLEVLNQSGEWIPAPHIPGSIVVNIGGLTAQVSGSR